MLSTERKKREPADPNIEREYLIKRLMREKGTSGRKIALANQLSCEMVTETIRGVYKSARVRRIIAEAIGTEYAALWGEE
jgi:lambda repressor-like predicted transcriptional regulator